MSGAVFDTPGEAWFAAVQACLDLDPFRDAYDPRGRATVEMPGPQHFRVVDPLRIEISAVGRDLRHVIGVVEGLSLVGQTSIPEVILDKVAAFRPFMRNSVFWGAYGPRAAGDVGQAVDLLRRDQASRQAVITLFDSDRDLGRVEQVDLPCTVALQYMVRRGELEAWTVMRSNDVWLGLPYDLMQFGMLQGAIAQALGIPVGTQSHSAGSLHLYKRDFPKAMLVTSAASTGLEVYWGGEGGIDETASRARRILLGQRVPDATAFEEWCMGLLS